MIGRLAAIAILLALEATHALAQAYPNRPVKVVVPFPAGGGTDALTRFVAKGMEQRLGQPFIIENRGGAVHHIYAELLMHMTGISMRHVPYRGGGMALNDVVAGHVPVYFADAGPAAPLIRSGKLKALGVTTATCASHLPEVPTLHEAG